MNGVSLIRRNYLAKVSYSLHVHIGQLNDSIVGVTTKACVSVKPSRIDINIYLYLPSATDYYCYANSGHQTRRVNRYPCPFSHLLEMLSLFSENVFSILRQTWDETALCFFFSSGPIVFHRIRHF